MKLKLKGSAIGVGNAGEVVDVDDEKDAQRLIDMGIAEKASTRDAKDGESQQSVKQSSPRRIKTNDDSSTTEPRNPNVDIHQEGSVDDADSGGADTDTQPRVNAEKPYNSSTSDDGGEGTSGGGGSGFFGRKSRK
jgi:hypothetical protein